MGLGIWFWLWLVTFIVAIWYWWKARVNWGIAFTLEYIRREKEGNTDLPDGLMERKVKELKAKRLI